MMISLQQMHNRHLDVVPLILQSFHWIMQILSSLGSDESGGGFVGYGSAHFLLLP